MEKIWVQFNESDYQIYHNYCLRYYTINDATRKRSIHLFLELFEKGMFPVGEHDLGDVFLFFSKKCDELQSDHKLLSKSNSAIDHQQFQVFRDIQILIEDIEKIYRLIQKTGVISNYLLVLATFSKIIEEEKNAYLSAVNEQDRNKIESLAPKIAKIIWTRLDSDAGWESVLYELTTIVRKFNRASPDEKIDLDNLFLIGSAVVSHFNDDVGYEEIQSTLERYFDESELAEFESFLNNKPDLPDNDTDSDSSDDVLFEILKSISCRGIDQEYHETVSEPRLLKSADIPPAISKSVIPRNSEAIATYGRTITPYSGKINENYSGRFDIGISDTVKSLVVLPKKKIVPPYNVYMKPGIPQYSLLIGGFIILILFAITIGPASGIWNPVKSLDNTSTGIPGNVSNTVNLQKNSSPSAKIDPVNVVANKTNISLSSLSTKKGFTSAELNKHFITIAFGPGNTKIQKPAQGYMSIAISGNNDKNDTAIVEQFIDQFNDYSMTNKINSNIKSGDMADIVLIFLPEATIKNIAILDYEALDGATISKNPKTGLIYYLQKNEKHQFFTTKIIYFNSDLKGDQRIHWILRSLLYKFGFTGETNDYSDSIFYSSDNTTQLSEIDLKSIELMYSNKIARDSSVSSIKALLPI